MTSALEEQTPPSPGPLTDEEVGSIAVKMFRIATMLLADEKVSPKFKKELASHLKEAFEK